MTFDTSKIDEWDLDTCRDWLAMKAGWAETTPSMLDGQAVPLGSEWHRPTVNGSPGSLTWCIHPIPATLDEAAKLPEGTRWHGGTTYSSMTEKITGYECRSLTTWKQGNACAFKESSASGDTELLARFRLRCKVESRPH